MQVAVHTATAWWSMMARASHMSVHRVFMQLSLLCFAMIVLLSHRRPLTRRTLTERKRSPSTPHTVHTTEPWSRRTKGQCQQSCSWPLDWLLPFPYLTSSSQLHALALQLYRTLQTPLRHTGHTAGQCTVRRGRTCDDH